jgi:NADP-dependent 3-hydroxy acid dehydrogenase YdfG
MRPRTVLITGASSGIGHALALEYASRGATVAIAARRHDLLDELAHDIQRRGGRALCLAVDVADPEAAKEAVLKADHDLGSLDMVIANAGVGGTRHSTRIKWDEAWRMIDVNVRGAMATLLAAVPVMLHHKQGQLVGVSSLAGRRGLPTSAVYSASKAALSTFLESLRVDLAPAGIRVTDIQPGFVESEMTAKNAFKMPLIWPADKAARHIATRLEKAPAVVAFPWPFALLTGFARLLPTALYDRIIRMTAGSMGVGEKKEPAPSKKTNGAHARSQ